MAGRMLDIPDLGEKINLLLKHAVNDVHNATILAKKSNISPDYISRFRSGQRRISSNNLKKLSKAYPDISEALWCESLSVFAQELGLSKEKTKPAFPVVMGIDFESRIKDRNFLEKRFEIMKGYWEMFFYSVSAIDSKYIIFNILELSTLNEHGYIECTVSHGDYCYRGYCFFVGSVTYFMLEEIMLLNEIIFILTNSPVRATNPSLNGILLALTGGSSELVSVPSATKIALRHVGASTDELADKYGIDKNLSIREIIQEIRIRINSDPTQLDKILPLIDNQISQDTTPYVLRAKLF